MGRKKAEETIEETETNEEVVDTRSKRQIVIDTINEGGATLDSLTEAAGCKYTSIMSIFSTLRLMGMCPVKDVDVTVDVPGEDGEVVEAVIQTYRFVTADEWETIKADKAANAKTKKAPARSPEEQLALLEKRVEKATAAVAATAKRAEDDGDSRILAARSEVSVLQLEIATIELENLQAKMAE